MKRTAIKRRRPSLSAMSRKLRGFARGQTCTLRIPTVCNYDPSTVVLCHGRGAGHATKTSDLHAAVHGCAACHHWLDHIATREEYEVAFARALLATLLRVDRAGLLPGIDE